MRKNDNTMKRIDITYEYTTKAELIFDRTFHIIANALTLDKLRDSAIDYMLSYNFIECDIIDTCTGEVLISLKDPDRTLC